MMIIGLPRSRTAWLSVFMSQSNTYFHHEAINNCFSLVDYKEKIKGCGDSTTGFSFLLDYIKSNKVVIIKKNDSEINDCIAWCDKEYSTDSNDNIIKMNGILSGIEGLVINQADINDNLKAIWEYLVDDEWCESYKSITKFNIQTSDTSINKEAAKSFYETIQ